MLEIRGGSTFRVGAYRRAAECITCLSEPLEVIRRRGELQTIPGVGGSIARKIEELLDTETRALLEEVGREVPSGVATLLSVPEISPKRARILWEEAGVDDLDALRGALEEDRVDELLGTGEARHISEGLESLWGGEENRLPLGVAPGMALDKMSVGNSSAG